MSGVPAEVFDADRVRAVRATGLLDTVAEEAFDRLAQVASIVLDAPFAFITLVDDRRSFWKSCIGEGITARENPVEESFCQYVIGSGRRLVVGDTAADERTRNNPSIHSMGVAAWAGCPIHAPSGEVLGTLCVVDVARRDWTDRDVSVLETLSLAASGEIALRDAARRAERHAVELSLLVERASALATTLQESLLPPHLPDVPGAEIAAAYLTAGTGEVLGDFYDVFPTSAETWGVVLGDVSGKGVPAAKVAALARYTIRAAAVHHREPCAILDELNTALLTQHAHGNEGFVTAVFLSIRSEQDRLAATVCGGGHPPVLLRRTDGSVEQIQTHGPILGVFDDAALLDIEVSLDQGDLLLLYSDGVTDAHSDEGFFGQDRLVASLQATNGLTARQTVSAIEERVVRHNPGERTDDIALLAVRITAPRRLG